MVVKMSSLNGWKEQFFWLTLFCLISFGQYIIDGRHLFHINSVGSSTLLLPGLQFFSFGTGDLTPLHWTGAYLAGGPTHMGVNFYNPLFMPLSSLFSFDQALIAYDLVLKVIGGTGVLLLARGINKTAAALAAGLFVLNGFHAAAGQDFSYSQPMFIAPWVILAMRRVCERPDKLSAAILSLSLTVTYLTSSLQSFLFLSFYLFLPYAVLSMFDQRHRLRPVFSTFALAVVLNAGIIFFDLYSQYMSLTIGNRSSETSEILNIIEFSGYVIVVSGLFVMGLRVPWGGFRKIVSLIWLAGFLLPMGPELNELTDIFFDNYSVPVSIADFAWEQQFMRYQFTGAGFVLLSFAAWRLAAGRVDGGIVLILALASSYLLCQHFIPKSHFYLRAHLIPVLGIVLAQGIGVGSIISLIRRWVHQKTRIIALFTGLLVAMDAGYVYQLRTIFSDAPKFIRTTTPEEAYLQDLSPVARVIDVFEDEHINWRPLPMERRSILRHMIPAYFGAQIFSRVGVSSLPTYAQAYHEAAIKAYYGASPEAPVNALINLAGVDHVITNQEPPLDFGLVRVVSGEAYNIFHNPQALPRVQLFSGAQKSMDKIALQRLVEISRNNPGFAQIAPEDVNWRAKLSRFWGDWRCKLVTLFV